MKRNSTVNFFQSQTQIQDLFQIVMMKNISFLVPKIWNTFLDFVYHQPFWRKWRFVVQLMKFSWILQIYLKNELFSLLLWKLPQFLISLSDIHLKFPTGKGWLITQPYMLFASRYCIYFSCSSGLNFTPIYLLFALEHALKSCLLHHECLFQSSTTCLGHLTTRVLHQFFSNKHPKPIQVR